MQHLDEGTIHAWLDGELSPSDAEQIEAHTRECAECAQRVAEARGLIAASTRILNALDNVPSGVVPSAATPIAPARSRRGVHAAAVTLKQRHPSCHSERSEESAAMRADSSLRSE